MRFEKTRSSKKQISRQNTAGASTLFETLEARELLSSYFVSTSGSDSANGSNSTPWRSVQHAINSAKPGDIINLRSGNYAGGITIDKPNLTIQSAPGEKASISTSYNDSSVEVNVRMSEDASGTKLLNLDLSGGYYYTVKTDSLVDTGAPREYGASNILIEGCKIHDSGRDVIKLTPASDNITIRKTEIYNSGRRDGSNAEGIDGVNVDNFKLQDSSVHDTTTNGVYLKGGSIGTVIERNRVYNTAHSGIILGQSSDENWFDTKVNPGYYESIDGTVRNNVVWNTEGAGISAWAALRPKIYNNTMTNVAKSMMGGILITGQEHWTPDSRIIPSTDVTLANNIVVVNSSRPVVDIRPEGLTGYLNTSNNRYYQPGRAAAFWDERSEFYGNLAQWKAKYGDSGSSEGDPRVDGNGHLLSGSPAINTGRALGGFNDDIDRQTRPAGGAWDIGADESGASSTPAPKPVTNPTPNPTPQPKPSSTQGLKAEYFDNMNFTGRKVTRTDRTINYDWRTGSPAAGIGNETFSVRWTGKVTPKFSQTYMFYTTSDDGVRLWVNGKQIINNWTNHRPADNKGSIALQAGKKYDIKMEYYENAGGAVSKLLWASASQPKQIIQPTSLSVA